MDPRLCCISSKNTHTSKLQNDSLIIFRSFPFSRLSRLSLTDTNGYNSPYTCCHVSTLLSVIFLTRPYIRHIIYVVGGRLRVTSYVYLKICVRNEDYPNVRLTTPLSQIIERNVRTIQVP